MTSEYPKKIPHPKITLVPCALVVTTHPYPVTVLATVAIPRGPNEISTIFGTKKLQVADLRFYLVLHGTQS